MSGPPRILLVNQMRSHKLPLRRPLLERISQVSESKCELGVSEMKGKRARLTAAPPGQVVRPTSVATCVLRKCSQICALNFAGDRGLAYFICSFNQLSKAESLLPAIKLLKD